MLTNEGSPTPPASAENIGQHVGGSDTCFWKLPYASSLRRNQELSTPCATVFTGTLRADIAVCCMLFMLGTCLAPRLKVSFLESLRCLSSFQWPFCTQSLQGVQYLTEPLFSTWPKVVDYAALCTHCDPDWEPLPSTGSDQLSLKGTNLYSWFACANMCVQKQCGLYLYTVARTLSFHPRGQRSLTRVLVHSHARSGACDLA